jgi:phage gp36-like protein
MSYNTPQDIRTTRITRFPAGTQGDAILTSAIAGADAEVNVRLAARYTVPFDPVPEVVRQIAGDLAAARALLAVHSAAEEEESATARAWREQALALLDLLASGEYQGDKLVQQAVLSGETRPVGIISTTYGRRQDLSDPLWIYGPRRGRH